MTTSFPLDGAQLSRVRTYLIYLVLDTSESMRRPPRHAPQQGAAQTHFERLIPEMLRQLSAHPVLNNLAAASVVAFNDNPDLLRPMTPLNRSAAITKPKLGFATNYAAVLKFLVDQHAKDVRAVKLSRPADNYAVDVASPWVFFITDGLPFANGKEQELSDWIGYRDRLVNAPIGARIAAIGLPGADADTLYQLATGKEDGTRNAFIADKTNDLRELVRSVVTAIESSISSSASSGLLTIQTPVGMSRVDGPRS